MNVRTDSSVRGAARVASGSLPDHGTDMTLRTGYHTIQTLLWPENGISTERKLYFRLSGAAGFSASDRNIVFGNGGRAVFDTAFNLFNFGKWQHFCELTDLHLSLEGRGRFELAVWQAVDGQSSENILSEIVILPEGEAARVELSDLWDAGMGGAIFFSLTALGEARLGRAEWQTRQHPLRQPDLALSITTFRREEAVRRSVGRFETFVASSPIARHLHLIVVDNGQSAEIASNEWITAIPNANLGGSGGFARGLIEAEQRGASHCLFMDDDASIHMDALERVWAFLAYTVESNTAVAGALTMSDFSWTLWENGSLFNMRCKPQGIGTDLRDFEQVLQVESDFPRAQPHNYYGGWWFFAFPLAFAKHRPFPFFVRGDDISFSLANDFRIATLPGVACFQDADFADKESLQTLYLDLRSHLIHHLALPKMEISRPMTLSVPLRFFGLSLLQCHYETLEALNISFEDVLRGPDFFAENADMTVRRADLAAIRKDEAWKPIEGPLPAERIRFDPKKAWVRLFMKATLNGHLLPFFRHYGNRRVLRAGRRGAIRETWAAAEITYVNPQGQYFTVRHSKTKALRQGWRMFRNVLRLNARLDRIKAEWREGYEKLATDRFWRARLGLADATPAEARPRTDEH